MSEPMRCWVCGEEETDIRLLNTCDNCQQDFHLNPFQTPGTNCGGATPEMDEEELVLQFYCQPCRDGTTERLLAERSAHQ